MESAWAWQPSRLVSAASEEKVIGANGPVQVDDGHGLLLGGDEGDRDGGKVQVDVGHGLLLGGDEGDRDGGKVQVDDGHGFFAWRRRR